MDWDDIVYLALLISSIAFGYVYRPIEDKQTKRYVGTAAGLFIVLVVSGVHVVHTLIFILVNSFIILHTDRRYVANTQIKATVTGAVCLVENVTY